MHRRYDAGVTTYIQAWNSVVCKGIIEKVIKHTNGFIEGKVTLWRKMIINFTRDPGILPITLRMSHVNLHLHVFDDNCVTIFLTTMSL